MHSGVVCLKKAGQLSNRQFCQTVDCKFSTADPMGTQNFNLP